MPEVPASAGMTFSRRAAQWAMASSNVTSPQFGHLRAHQFAGLSPGPRLIVLGGVHGNEV